MLLVLNDIAPGIQRTCQFMLFLIKSSCSYRIKKYISMTWIITKIKQQKSLLSSVAEELKIKASKHLFRFFTPTEMENSRGGTEFTFSLTCS